MLCEMLYGSSRCEGGFHFRSVAAMVDRLERERVPNWMSYQDETLLNGGLDAFERQVVILQGWSFSLLFVLFLSPRIKVVLKRTPDLRRRCGGLFRSIHDGTTLSESHWWISAHLLSVLVRKSDRNVLQSFSIRSVSTVL